MARQKQEQGSSRSQPSGMGPSDHIDPQSQHSDGDDPVGAAERDVGRYVYRRIEALMDAKPGTPDAEELEYLATIAESVEEYGAEACGGHDLSGEPRS